MFLCKIGFGVILWLCILGRDDFNFSSWILSASPHIAPVTERNTLDYMVLVWGVCYTPHKCYPCDRIFFRECKNRFLGFLLLISDLMLAIFTKTSSVTKRNIMDGVKRWWVWPTPPTSAHIVTENPLTGTKDQKCLTALQKHK